VSDGWGWRGAARGECGENVESFCSRGRPAYVGFSWLLLLAPVRGGTSFLFKREKKRSKETRFKPPIPKCRRCALEVFGTNVARPQIFNRQSNTLPKHKRRAHASPQRPYINGRPRSRNIEVCGPRASTPLSTTQTQSNSDPKQPNANLTGLPPPVAGLITGLSARVAHLSGGIAASASGNGIGAVEAKRVRAACEKGRCLTAGCGCGSRTTFGPKT